MEKRFFSHIYRHAFFPHEMAWKNDQLFRLHLEKNLAHIDVDHEALQIPKKFRGEMPWLAAQEALLRINAFRVRPSASFSSSSFFRSWEFLYLVCP